MRSLSRLGLWVTSLAALLGQAFAIPEINMTKGVSPISRDIYELHMTIFLICCVVGVVVFGVILFSLMKYRKSQGAVADKDMHGNTTLEIIWSIIPFLILVVMAVPATRVLIDMHDTKKAEVDIKVVGYQWKWEYEYLNEGITFFSNLATPLDAIHNKVPKGEHYLLDVDNELVVPVHTKIRFLVTSNDVIHSWWVPAFGVKRDAIPGFIHEAWTIIDKPGTYRGQCAELCGQNHGYMPIVVKAVSKLEYKKWVDAKLAHHKAKKKASAAAASKTWTLKELMAKGKKTYLTHCAACHRADGKGMPPAFPALAGKGISIGPVSKHIDIVVHGKKGTAMQAFGSQLDDATLAAVVTYERNAWGNDKLIKNEKDRIVQPSEIAAAKKK